MSSPASQLEDTANLATKPWILEYEDIQKLYEAWEGRPCPINRYLAIFGRVPVGIKHGITSKNPWHLDKRESAEAYCT